MIHNKGIIRINGEAFRLESLHVENEMKINSTKVFMIN